MGQEMEQLPAAKQERQEMELLGQMKNIRHPQV